MLHDSFPSGGRIVRRKRRSLLPTALLVAISLSPVAFFADLKGFLDALPAAPVASPPRQALPQAAAAASSPIAFDAAFIDPKPALGAGTLRFADTAPLPSAFQSPAAPQTVSVAQAEPPAAPEPVPLPPPSPVLQMAEAAQPDPIPLPVPRPAEFRLQRPPEAPKMAGAPAPAQAMRTAALPSAPADNRNFIEKLFGLQPATKPEAALSYASVDGGIGTTAPSPRFSPAPSAGAGVAVYDISAQVVTLPNGERLEAHSGLGDKLDDPRFVHVAMRGATPPGTYDLTEREALFHGVRAIRLNPVGGSAAIYGRVGLLAHTYMLGPKGDSNGCISFRNYDRFLQAYLRGEVKRLVVVLGRGQDALPSIVNRRGGQRYAQSASNT